MRTKDEIFRTAYARQRMKGTVQGPGDLGRIRRAYQWQRRLLTDATTALDKAMHVKTVPLYAEPCIGAPNEHGYRHLTKPKAFGLRWVNYSDGEVTSMGHKGWFISTEGRTGEVYRGCVLQLPGKGGRARLVAGYHDAAADYYVVDLSTIYEAVPRDHPTEQDDVYNDVARVADRMAERDAERERDYDEKYQVARRWVELQDTLTGIECGCDSAEDKREEIEGDIREIEGNYLDIADFARNNL